MRFKRLAVPAIISCFTLCGSASRALAQASSASHQQSARNNQMVANLAAIAWLGGHWVGTAGKNSTEEICSSASQNLMTCMFRFSAANKLLWIELWSLYDTPQGLVAQVRFFHTNLEPLDPPAATYHVRISEPDRLLFVNAGNTGPRSLTVMHLGVNNFLSRVETIGPDGKSTFLENSMHRVP
jgi:hypothetical protein